MSPDYTAIGTFAVLVIGALGAAAKVIIDAIHETRQVVKDVVHDTKTEVQINAANASQAGLARDLQLQRIELLVDGRYGSVLQELADLRRLIATYTGDPADARKADDAQVASDQQAARVAASEAKP